MRGFRIALVALLPALLAAMTTVIGLAGSASASTTTTTLKSSETGYCLEGDFNGTVYAPACTGLGTQNWIMQPVSSALNHGLYNLVNAATGQCLDSNPSGNIYTLPCNGGNYQVWATSPIGTGPSQFQDFQTALCLDGSNGNAYTLACNGGGYQYWYHASVPFQILDNLAQKCVGIFGGLAGSYTCTTNPDQTWHWGQALANSGGFAQLVNGNGACLGVVNKSTSYGADINATACGSDPSQYWQPLTSPDSSTGYYYLENYNSGLVLGIGGGSTANGASLVQWTKLTHPDQYWYGRS
jgi:serine/threonine-protein kinase